MDRVHSIARRSSQLDDIFKKYETTIEKLHTEAENSTVCPKKVSQIANDLSLIEQELKQEVSKVNQSYYRLEQLINATQIPVLFLDKELRIQRYTPEVKKIFDQAEFTKGELLSSVLKPSTFKKLDNRIQNFFANPVQQEVELYLKKLEEWYFTRILPYPASGDKVHGVLITFLNITKDKEYEKKLNKLNETLELEIQKQKQQVKKLASEAIAAEQKEQKRISRLLHNDLQQQLFSIQTKTQLLNDEIPAEFTEETDEIIEQIQHSLQLTHQLVVSLSPPNIESNRLHKGINWLCEHIYNFHGLLVQTKNIRHIKLENKDILILILQMIQELLFNVVKHAGVDKAKITTTEKKEEIHIHVIDEGKGFNKDELEEGMVHFGLSNTEEQLALIDGHLLVNSTPGKGTDICLIIPSKYFIKTDED